MNLSDAINLIKDANIDQNQALVWTDLGCGTGLFTQALTHILPAQSTIFAIDKTAQVIEQVVDKPVKIEFLQADFAVQELILPPLNGVLMANSLHYIAEKEAFLQRLQKLFNGPGAFIIIEYDTMQANPWIPYPIDFNHLQDLFTRLGFKNIIKLGERPSIYGSRNIYATYIF